MSMTYLKVMGVLALLISSLSLVSCGKSGDDVKRDIGVAARNVQQEFEFQGKWISDCGKGSQLGLLPRHEYEFTANDFTKRSIFYDDNNCTTAAIIMTQRGSLDRVGDAPESGKKINFNVKEVVVVGVTDKGIRSLNTGPGFCGLHWTLNQEQSVGEKSGSVSCLGLPAKAPRKVFDIVKVDGRNLVLGSDMKNEDESDRPVKYDNSALYHKE